MKYPENKPTRGMTIIKARVGNYSYPPSYEIEYIMSCINDLSGGNKVFAWAEIPSVGNDLLLMKRFEKLLNNGMSYDFNI